MADSDSYEEYRSDEEAKHNDVTAVRRKKAEVPNATDERPRDVIKTESGEKKKEKKKKKEKQDQDDENKKEKKKEKKTKEGKKEKRTKEPKEAKTEVEKKPEASSVVVVAQETATLPVTEVVVEAVSEAVPVVELAVSPVEVPEVPEAPEVPEVPEVHRKTEKTTSVSVEPEVPVPAETTTATEAVNESSEKQSPSDVTSPEAEPVTAVAATSASKHEPETAELKPAEPETTVAKALEPEVTEPEVTEPEVTEPEVVAPEEAPKETSEQAAPSTIPEPDISAQPATASGSAELPETPSVHPVSCPPPPPPSVKVETTSNLRPGIQEILAHAQRVADERASCSSKVLSAKSLISRQEKLHERIVEMRSSFTDFDSEIRALRLDAYKNQQKRLQKY